MRVLVGIPRDDAFAIGGGETEFDQVRELHAHAETVAAVVGEHERVVLIGDPFARRERELRVACHCVVVGDSRRDDRAAAGIERVLLLGSDPVGVPGLLLVDPGARRIDRHPFACVGHGVDQFFGRAIVPRHEPVARRSRFLVCEALAELVRPARHGHRAHPVELAERVPVGEREAGGRLVCGDACIALRSAEPFGPWVAVVDAVVGAQHERRPARIACGALELCEQAAADAPTPQLGCDPEHGREGGGRVGVELPRHVRDADQPVVVPRTEGASPDVPFVAVEHEQLVDAEAELVGAVHFDRQCLGERHIRLEVGGLGSSERGGYGDRADIDVHLRGCTLRPAPMRAADQAIGAPIRPQP